MSFLEGVKSNSISTFPQGPPAPGFGSTQSCTTNRLPAQLCGALCEMGRYKGDLGRHQGDLKIFIYDPNYPNKTMTLVPNLREKFFYYKEFPSKKWRTYFLSTK